MAIKNSWASGEVLTAADLTDTFKGVFVNAQTGTSYTLGTADSFVSISNASGGTVTIPTNATAAFNTGAVVGIMNAGTAGTYTIGTAAGVTLNSTTGGTTLLPLETVYVVKLGTNTWQTKRDPGIVNAGGLVYITGNTFSASSAVNVNNCFTSTYANYRISFVGTASTVAGLRIRLRLSGTDSSASYNIKDMFLSGSTTVSSVYTASGPEAQCGSIDTNGSYSVVDVSNPNAAAYTNLVGSATANTYLHTFGTTHLLATAYDGFTLFPSTGTLTGTVRVYGYRNS